MTDTYSVRLLKNKQDFSMETLRFIAHAGKELAKLHNEEFDWREFKIFRYAKTARVVVCYRNEEPVGVMGSHLARSIFDPKVVILYQDTIFCKPGSRALKYLLAEFIDFGKANANHILTMIGPKTGIKSSNLEKLGFKKLEEIYRIEV